MKRVWALVLCVSLGFGLAPAQAQLFWNPFRRTSPTIPPEQRVVQLLVVVKTDTDERKRLNAIDDLRDFDAKTHPEIVPILADVAQTDSRASIRDAAVTSLVRIRPISNTAGLAIESVASKDDNWRNRMNAQAALVRYRLAGYSSSAAHAETAKTPSPKTPQSQEPPLADRTPPPRPAPSPPILYYDQYGKLIPAPKGFPTVGPVTPVTPPVAPNVPGVNTSTPKSAPFTTIPSGPIAPVTPQPLPPGPAPVEPTFRPIAPPVQQPIQQPVQQPIQQPVQQPIQQPVQPAPQPSPTLLPPVAPLPRGPVLDLPPLPINNVPSATPNVPTPPPAPVAPLPTGRTDPGPRLTPAE